MSARLPTPGGDNGDWGDILNAYLDVSHNPDGTLAIDVVGTNQIANNAVTNAQLDSSTQSAISKANSSVQTVNSKSPTSGDVTLSASDVSAIPSSQLGAASGVATLNSSSQLSSSQLPSSVVSTGSVFTGTILGGSGDNLSLMLATPSVGQKIQLLGGAAGATDTTHAPLFKASRTISFLSSSVTGDAGEEASAATAITKGDANNQIQTVGFIGQAANFGTTKGTTDSPDACGIYGVGRILSSGIGVGMGAFFRGQADSPGGHITGWQSQAYNNTGRDDSVSSTGFSNSSIAWLWGGGPNRVGTGIALANPFGGQMDAGLHFVGQTGLSRTDANCGTTLNSATVTDASCVASDVGRGVTGTNIPSGAVITAVAAGVSFTFSAPLGATATATGTVSLTLSQVGPTLTADIQSDSNASYGLRIKGSHTSAAISVASGAGPVVIGGTSSGFSSAILDVQTSTSTNPTAVVRGSGSSVSATFLIQNGTNGARMFVAGGSGNFMTGTAAGDTGIALTTTSNAFFLGYLNSAPLIKLNSAGIGFFNTAPVAKQATTGTTSGFAAGAGTAMDSAATSTGGTGSSGYTFGDVILALKNYGLLTA